MASTASTGELATLYSPSQLAVSAVPVALVAALLALAAPYATGFACLGWAVGAVLAAFAAPRAGQAMYVLPFAVHVLAASTVVCLARRRAGAT